MMSIFLVLLEPDANQEDRQYNRVLSIVTVRNFVKSCQGYTALVMIPESGIPIICIHTHTRTTEPLWPDLSGILAEWEGQCSQHVAWTLVFSGKTQMTILLKQQLHSGASCRKKTTIHSTKEQTRFMKTTELDCLVKAWTKATLVQEIPILS